MEGMIGGEFLASSLAHSRPFPVGLSIFHTSNIASSEESVGLTSDPVRAAAVRQSRLRPDLVLDNL